MRSRSKKTCTCDRITRDARWYRVWTASQTFFTLMNGHSVPMSFFKTLNLHLKIWALSFFVFRTGRRKRDKKFIASYFGSIFQIQSLRKLQISLCNVTLAGEHAVSLSLAGWWCCCKQAFRASLLLHSILSTALRDNLPFPLLEGTFTFPLLYLPPLRPSFMRSIFHPSRCPWLHPPFAAA